jgi:hypothetical protein
MGLLRLLTTPFVSSLKLIGKQIGKLRLSLGGEEAKREREAQRLASTLLAEFHRLGFSRRVVSGKKKRKTQRVRYEEPLLLTPDELWCPIDLRRLPNGVHTDDLRDETVIHSLQDRCHVSVRPDYLATGKFCFVLRLRGATFPELFSINAFKLHPDSPMLSFPLGMDHDGEHSAADLSDLKHLLIVGATGGGKTTFLHTMLYFLISRNSDQDLELWLVDLKNGAELGRYDALRNTTTNPHGMVRHLAYAPDKAIDTLNLALKEIQRRNDLMRQHSASNIDDLAHLTGQRLRRIVLIVDEIAMLMLNRDKIGKYSTGSWAENLMTRIASLGRSAGIHLVIASQMIQRDVLSGMILANFENRVAFSCADWRKSQLAIETSEADGLPVGRAIFRREGKTAEYQTCLITPQQTRLEIDRIRRHGPSGGLGQHDEANTFVRDAKLLLTVACERLGGEFSRPKLLREEGVRGVISQERFNEIARRLEQDGVLDPARSRQGRRVARGYFNRPQLLDLLYSPNGDPARGQEANSEAANSTPTAHAPDARCFPTDGTVDSHQEAPKSTRRDEAPAVRCLEDSTTHTAPGEQPDSDLLDPFKRLFEEPDDQAEGQAKS